LSAGVRTGVAAMERVRYKRYEGVKKTRIKEEIHRVLQ